RVLTIDDGLIRTLEPESRLQVRVGQTGDVLIITRIWIFPVVNQLVVDVRDGHRPIVVDVKNKIVLELRQIDDALVKLFDLEFSREKYRALSFKLVLQVDLEIDRAGVGHELTVRRILSAVANPNPTI